MKRTVLFLLFLVTFYLIYGLSVYDIQYTTEASGNSPYMDQTVTVTGIVSAVNWYSGGSTARFCMCDPEGGEWRGIYVYNSSFEVELGDEIEVEALVQEYFEMTELSELSSLTVLSSGNPIPAPIEVTTGELASTEAYEGVLVRVNNVEVTQGQDDYGQAYIDDGSGECQTDDAMYDYDPVVGDEFGYMIGIVDYSYDEYGLNPRTAADIGYPGEPGYIEGEVLLDGGTGNVEDVVIQAGGFFISPNEWGEYELELPPGVYDVTATLAGYMPQTISEVLVEEDETTSEVDFTLVPMGDTTIYDIQYTESASGASPLAGQVVTVTGIVTGSGFTDNNYFFISTPEGGAWNGLYVYQYDYVVALGDEITLTGTVSEYYGFTELGTITDLTINSSGNPLPAAVEITTEELSTSEAYESVLVKVTNVEVMALPDQEYGEWYVDDGSGQCQVDDGFDAEYPDLEIGDEFLSITGIVDYSFDEYGLHPRDMDDYVPGEGPDITAIYDIQYTEEASGDSPLAGETVTVEAVVNGINFQGNGFFVTALEGGAWKGIYVYDEDNDPEIGDQVRLTAEVSEYYGMTELESISSFEIISSGNTVPEAVSLSTGEAASEAYESIFIEVSNVTVTQEPDAQYGEWYVDDGSGAVQIDDGFFSPEEADPPILIELGMTINSLSGIIDYSFSEFGINPRCPEDISGISSDSENLLSADTILQGWPNPYYPGSRSMWTLSFELEKDTAVEVSLYNLKGQKISELANRVYSSGRHQLNWDGCGSDGLNSPSGIYLYRFKGNGIVRSGKLLLIK